ncbi:MAG: anaerobic ribonucleoside triphosphate reductase [Ruminococcaceae bacterium]|nr:anaerobic ribonucleoside triphosphate reductase [Oscillospiraceae bacterium]
MITNIVKRDGRTVEFNIEKIGEAIFKALQASGSRHNKEYAINLAYKVEEQLAELGIDTPTVEQVQDVVESTLIREGLVRAAKSYILYRAERTRVRNSKSRLMQIYDDITFSSSRDSELKRSNANVNGDTPMGTMLMYGSEGAKQFYEMFVLKPEHSKAHIEGDIHIHDLDFLTLTTTCCQIDIIKLFKDGFCTGHGALREPQDIYSYAALACIAIQSNQNDQHGGQSIQNFDYGLAPGVKKTFIRKYRQNLMKALVLLGGYADEEDKLKAIQKALLADGLVLRMEENEAYLAAEHAKLVAEGYDAETLSKAQAYSIKKSIEETDAATAQAMEALIHNLNTMHSRAGAQTPFSSINYGMDTTAEGRMVIKNVLLAQEAGLGNGETPIFPIHIFRVKEGVNYNPEDPNYDLFKLAMHVSAKRLFPNFSFIDAPFNLQYYNGTPESEISYMGCRTRVMGNVYDPSREISTGRGNLSFTSINLPRIAIKANKDLNWFFDELDRKIDLCVDQLLERFEIQKHKKVRNFPFLMGEGVWLDSEKLGPDDEVGEVLKHGTLSVGFIGLAESLVALLGVHHGQSEAAQNLGIEIISHMREVLDAKSKEMQLNFSLLATPAEGLSGRFIKMDRARFGVIPGITDREYYTNSFHIPVYFPINAFDKIRLEAPYHALTNAGHITYVELDGDVAKNLTAYEKVIRAMHDAGIGYGSVNHPVDRDPVCGYNGIIDDECPQCGRTEESGQFERIRRITGYLVGTMDKWNSAKRAEERDRVKHTI